MKLIGYDQRQVEFEAVVGKTFCLMRIADDTCREQLNQLAVQFSHMSPWVDIELKPENLLDHFTRPDPALFRYMVVYDEQIVGAISIRSPWLKGPYLELLGLKPDMQGLGLGQRLMHWFETEAPVATRSLWLLCSDFNHQAIGFYEAMGYEKQCLIDNLYSADFDDYLMRKRKL